jgi:hypothetical protein
VPATPGLRVTNLILRQNPEPDALSVQSSEQTHIDLEDVARAVEHLLDPNFANVPAELVLHPRSSAHSDRVLPEVACALRSLWRSRTTADCLLPA